MNVFLPQKKKSITYNKNLNPLFRRLTFSSVFAFLLLMSGGVFGQATLPLTRTTWNSTPTGWTDSAGGSYTSSFACSTNNGAKFDSTSDRYIVNFDSAPNELTFVTKSNNTNSTSVLLVEESTNGSTYTTVVSLTGNTNLGNSCATKGPYTLNSSSRYVRYTFTKGSSNLTMDDVSITKPSGFTLTYSGNANTTGTAPTDGSSPYASGATVTVLGNTGSLTKTNYNFTGWNTLANGTGTDRTVASTFSMPAANTTLYAKWTGNVSYNANGGTGTVTDAMNYLAGASVSTASGAGFTRASYTLIGWNTLANGLGSSYTLSEVGAFTFAGNTTLYAVWNPVGSKTVIFEANGGTGIMANQTESSATNLTSNSFTRTGYTFANWNTVSDGSGTSYTNGQSYDFAANITLYARWTATNNTVTFNGNGSTSGSMSNQTIATDATAALTSNSYSRTGYTFASWNTLADGTGTNYSNGASYVMGTADVTLYAKWTPNNNTVTFDGNGSTSGSMSNQTIVTAATATLTSNAYTRTGYTFASWNTASDGSGTTYADGASYTMGTSSVTLYAQWDAYVGPCLTDNFNSNYGNWTGGSGTYNNSSAGETGNGVGFNDNNDDIITSSATSNAMSITFRGRASGSTSNFTMVIQTSTSGSGPWTDEATIVANGSNSGTITNSWSTYNFTFAALGTYYIRFLQSPRSGGSFYLDDVEVYCGVACTPPGTSATALTVNNATVNSLDLNFTRGNGDGVMIVARAGATPATAPLSGTSYSVSDAVGGGTVVYKGTASGASTATTQTISSLLQNTQYQFSIYEYVSATDCYQVTALAGSGTTLYREINVKGNSVSIVNNDVTPALTDHTDFSTAYVAGGTVVRTFTIENTGTSALTLSGSSPYVAISGTNAADFSVTATPSASIGAASSTTFNITFDPSALGSRSATLTIANNDSDENPYVFAISGEGTCTPSANPVGTIGGTFDECITTDITYTGADAATSYWQTTASGTSTAEPVTTAKTVTVSGTYYVRNYASSCWSASSISQVVTIATPPSISTQPVSQTVLAGATPTFTVVASGSGLTYQWQSNIGAGWNNVATGTGGTTASYTTAAATLSMSGTTYRVLVSGASCGSVNSNIVTLTVDYCTSSPSSNDNSGITNVVIGSADFPVTDVTYYNYTGSVPNLVQGASIVSSITFATGFTYHNHIWIDFNDDGVFNNTNEKVWSGESLSTNPTTYTTTFTLGGTSALGEHKMRIGTADSGQSTATPCYSGTYGVTIDLMVNVIIDCTPAHTVSSFTPTSGPVGTVVTLIGTGFSPSTTATLGGVSATVAYVNSTKINITIPSGVATAAFVIGDAATCKSYEGTFTLIDAAFSSCEGALTDLFMSQVTDASDGGLSYVEIFNGTGSTVNLSGYSVQVANNGGGVYSTPIDLDNFDLAAGGIYTLAISATAPCAIPGGNGSYADQSTTSGGVNFKPSEHDHIGLFNGTTLIDSWGNAASNSWANGLGLGTAGANFSRKTTATVPSTTYANADWDIVNWDDCAGTSYSDIGTYDLETAATPVITTQPAETVLACGTTSTDFAVSATEGTSGGAAITYQWYFNVPGNASWAVVSGADFTGGTTATLSVANASTYEDYQFYCQVRENTATCSKATQAIGLVGATGTITFSGSTWIGGTPNDLTKDVIIETGSTYSTASGAIIARKLTNNGTLTVTDANPVTIEFELINNGDFNILDGGSLVQNCEVDNATTNANVGSISMLRKAKPMHKYDYTYWSSPVAGNTLYDLSPDTHQNRYYSYNPDTTPTWVVSTNGAATMVAGKGYIIRAPNDYGTDVADPDSYEIFDGFFNGKPNNGTVSIGVVGNTSEVDAEMKYNLLGNPYPSAIEGSDFLDDNDTVLGGTLYFWTHNSAFSGTGYNYVTSDYASWNKSGGVGTAATSIDDLNLTTNSNTPTGKIAAGQAFFVKGIADGTAVFNNAMRIGGNNNQFFRPNPAESANNSNATGVIETPNQNRVWLNLSGATTGFNQLLVGYFSNATNDFDVQYDGETFGGNSVTFYSVNNAKNLVIQGRALPFVNTDEVPLGYKTTLTGNLTISIDHVDGLFDDQVVYLKDNVLDVVHNLTDSDYVFATVPGTFDERFVLRYLPAVDLANPTFDEAINGVTIRKNDATMRINSPYETIDAVMVYDIMGRLVFEQKDCNTNTFEASHIVYSDQTLIVKVRLSNGGVATKKVL